MPVSLIANALLYGSNDYKYSEASQYGTGSQAPTHLVGEIGLHFVPC